MGARSENLAIIIGNLTRSPELKDTSGGHTVASFGVATNREWVTSDGVKQEDTQLHEVVAWDGLAKVCGQFLVKGSKVYIRGRLQTRTWEDDEGRRHYKTEIVSDKVVVLDTRSKEEKETIREEESMEQEVAAEAAAVEESIEGEELAGEEVEELQEEPEIAEEDLEEEEEAEDEAEDEVLEEEVA